MWLETTFSDFWFALRVLRKNPGYALAAMGTLALGMGATAAMFSVLNAVFLRPLAYRNPARLVWTTEYFPNFKRNQMFVPEYAAWRRESTVFEQLEGYGTGSGVNLSGDGEVAERVRGARVTPGFLTMLGVPAQVGRVFEGAEGEPGGERVAVIADSLWRNRFHADPRVPGKEIVLDGERATVIGVMPRGFLDPTGGDPEVWLPTAVKPKDVLPGRQMSFLGGVIGRLKEGRSVEQARSELQVIARGMDGQYPPPWSRYHAATQVRVVRLQEQLTGNSRRAIGVLLGAVGLMLMIACANVANLFLWRAAARQREMAIRAAMGASRLRVVRMLLMESLLLSAGGGLAGLALMKGGLSALSFLVPTTMPSQIPLDGRVFGFAVLCSMMTSLNVGLFPALAISKLDLNASLRSGVSVWRAGRGLNTGSVLAAAQIGLCMILLTGAGLLLRSFVSLLETEPGFNPHGVVLADIALTPQQLYAPQRQAEFFERTTQAARKIPGVDYAAVTDESPLKGFNSLASGLAAEGQPGSDVTVVPASISNDYFRALQVRLLAGRMFDERDRAGSAKVIMLNQRLAEILFPQRSAVGRRVRFGDDKDPWATVVGVVANMRHRSLEDQIWPEVFQPYRQAPVAWMSLVIKTGREPSSVIAAMRAAVAGIDPEQAMFAAESLDERLWWSVGERRRRAQLLGAFGAAGLVMAMTGVYSVLAYAVTRRTGEMGIRAALGARRSDIFAMVLTEGLWISIAGVALGVGGALAITRLLTSFLYGVTAFDPVTFLVVGLLLLGTACGAVSIPARRAARMDPLQALRQE